VISVVLSAHNEGSEVARTIDSIRLRTNAAHEIVLVDDGSTDRSCTGLSDRSLRVIRNEQRIGVAHSRNQAVGLSGGDVIGFFDAHQRVSTACIDRCAAIARRDNAIVWPDIRSFNRSSRTIHGAALRQCPDNGYFTADWRLRCPEKVLSRISAVRCPGYFIPRAVYESVRWINGLRNWGASEAAISVKAFFLKIPILHYCGATAWHLFKSELKYLATWDDVWRNQALIARVCFGERSWQRYWFPEVFERSLSDAARRDVESPAILSQHEEFQAMKVRKDDEFWTELLRRDVPAALC
jgi:glycosyltransferase involved in cell wall biosynthesis